MASNPTTSHASAAASSDGEESPPTPPPSRRLNPIFPGCPNIRALKALARSNRVPPPADTPEVMEPKPTSRAAAKAPISWCGKRPRSKRHRRTRGAEPSPAISPRVGSPSDEVPMEVEAAGIEVVEPPVPVSSPPSATLPEESDGKEKEVVQGANPLVPVMSLQSATPPVSEGKEELFVDATPPAPVISQSVTPPKESEGKKEELEALDMSMAAAAAPADAASSPPRARGCGFDLNLPPPEEAHDGSSSSA